jgi:hypothetical protein
MAKSRCVPVARFSRASICSLCSPFTCSSVVSSRGAFLIILIISSEREEVHSHNTRNKAELYDGAITLSGKKFLKKISSAK